jgi:hypothetical protein
MRSYWAYAAMAAAAAGMAWLWPLPAALPAGDIRTSRLLAAVVSVVVCLGVAMGRPALGGGARFWFGAGVLSLAGAMALALVQYDASGSCVAMYGTRPVIIGRTLQPYVQPEPGDSPGSLLFDAAGVPERVWTPESIRRCRWLLGWTVVWSIALFALGGCCLVQGARRRFMAPAAPRPAAAGNQQPAQYDFFLSYRHLEPDRGFALELLERLEGAGYRGAIDVRDFAPNAHFLAEMERCVKESRFVLCFVTRRYIDSDHTVEEAVLSKTLDLAERTRRVVPLIYEPVELPVWLHGLSGVDFTESSVVDPFERLRALLAQR